MKKKMKRFVALLLMIAMLVSMNIVPASAASNTRKCYTISSGNTTVYSNTGLSKKYGTIYGSDEVTVLSVTSSYSRVSYPVSRGTKTGYIRTSSILMTANAGTAYQSRAKITTYRRPGGYSYGYIASGDKVWVLGTKGDYVQVKYPVSGGYKYGWITKTNAQKYIYETESYARPANGTYVFLSGLNNSKAMDVNGGYTSNGTKIQLWDKNGTTAQGYTVKHIGNGWYSIRNIISNKAIDVTGGVRKSGTNVQLYEYNGTDAQLWRFYSAGNGYYYIQNKLGYYLSAKESRTANGTNLIVSSKTGGSNQKWKLTTYQAPKPTYTTKYVNTTAGLVLRKSASTNSSKLTVIPYKGAVTVYSESNGWAYVSYGGKKGYVSSQYLSHTLPEDTNQSSVKARLDKIAAGKLSINSSTVMAVGKTFKGTRANEQCKGYAKNVFYVCFGILPGSTRSKPNNYLLNNTSGMKNIGSVTNRSASSIKTLFLKARPGDFVQMRRTHGGSHSAIVYSVSSSGVTFLEANTDGKNTIFKNTYTWNTLANKNVAMSVYTASSYRLK